MYYSYILLSPKHHLFYYGSTNDLKNRVTLHNKGKVWSTRSYLPWQLVWYAGFLTEKEAREFEGYLKSGSGKAFSYKRLVSVALARDLVLGRGISSKRKEKPARSRDDLF
ncbi:MAG: GIY-YIG nuclease family protein [Patescibacteria group bacterium]